MPFHYAVAVDHPAADRWLTAAERRAWAAVPWPERRSDWRAGRVAAKTAAAGALGLDDPTRVALVPLTGGAPLVAVRGRFAPHRVVPLALSLAHRWGRAAAAATTERGELGIDLEIAGQARAAHAGYYLSRAERALAGWYGLTALWTLKEAAWKALRCDDSVPFTTLELRFDATGTVSGVSLGGSVRRAIAAVLHPWPGYVLAVVWLPREAR